MSKDSSTGTRGLLFILLFKIAEMHPSVFVFVHEYSSAKGFLLPVGVRLILARCRVYALHKYFRSISVHHRGTLISN